MNYQQARGLLRYGFLILLKRVIFTLFQSLAHRLESWCAAGSQAESTVHNMSIMKQIPQAARLHLIGGKFKAVLNDPTVGKYDFTNYKVGGDRFNVAVPLGLDMNPKYLYFFNQLNFSLSIDEGDFLNAISVDTVPTLSVKDSSTGKIIFGSPFRLFRYFEGNDVDSFHYNLNSKGFFIADFQCLLDQIPNLVGIQTIIAQVSFSVYEIIEIDYINAFLKKSG